MLVQRQPYSSCSLQLDASITTATWLRASTFTAFCGFPRFRRCASQKTNMLNDEVRQASAYPLALAQEGERVKIRLLRGGKGLEMRLTSLGLNIGSELSVAQRQGNTLVVIRGETRLALGAGMAQKIIVASA